MVADTIDASGEHAHIDQQSNPNDSEMTDSRYIKSTTASPKVNSLRVMSLRGEDPSSPHNQSQVREICGHILTRHLSHPLTMVGTPSQSPDEPIKAKPVVTTLVTNILNNNEVPPLMITTAHLMDEDSKHNAHSGQAESSHHQLNSTSD